MLEVGDDDQRDDNQQGPGTDLAGMHDLPALVLVRIGPGAEEGRDVFGDPDEEADQRECEQRQREHHEERPGEDAGAVGSICGRG